MKIKNWRSRRTEKAEEGELVKGEREGEKEAKQKESKKTWSRRIIEAKEGDEGEAGGEAEGEAEKVEFEKKSRRIKR